MKFKKNMLLNLLLVCLALIVPLTLLQVKGESTLSYPLSYTLEKQYSEINENLKYKKHINTSKTISFEYPDNFIVENANVQLGLVEFRNAIQVKSNLINNTSYSQFLIIPVVADPSDTSLAILEKFIVNFVGIAPKDNQKVYKKGNRDISIIGYSEFRDEFHGENTFSVYASLLEGGESWILITSYSIDDFTKKDPLEVTNSKLLKEFYNLVDTFQVLKPTVKNLKNSIYNSRITEEYIAEYKKNNNKYLSNY